MLRLKNRWNTEGGYREVLVIAIPLILSTATWSVQHFVDRMFLTWYSPETIAAAMPAGMLSFTMISVFMGTAPGPLAGNLYISVWWACHAVRHSSGGAGVQADRP